MSLRETDFPEFITAFRGYDRLQVDDYIERLRHYATQFEERALSAEPELNTAKLELARLRLQLDDVDTELVEARRLQREAANAELPQRLNQILNLASEEAESTREQARREAQEILNRTRTAAEEMLQRARRESETLMTEATRRRDGMEMQIVELDAARRTVIDHLTSVADEVRQTVAEHSAPASMDPPGLESRTDEESSEPEPLLAVPPFSEASTGS
jgi:cell division septum initiation protein DivIVA